MMMGSIWLHSDTPNSGIRSTWKPTQKKTRTSVSTSIRGCTTIHELVIIIMSIDGEDQNHSGYAEETEPDPAGDI
jgi:hypothetical protein